MNKVMNYKKQPGYPPSSWTACNMFLHLKSENTDMNYNDISIAHIMHNLLLLLIVYFTKSKTPSASLLMAFASVNQNCIEKL